MPTTTSEEREKILGDAYAAAPTYIQDAIQAGCLDDMTAALTAINSYDETTITRIENEVLMGILGITDLNNFTNTLTKEVGLLPEKVDATLAIINDAVFNPIAILGEDAPPDEDVPAVTTTPMATDSVLQAVTPAQAPAASAPILGTQKYQDPKPALVVAPVPVAKFRTMAMDVSGTKDFAPAPRLVTVPTPKPAITAPAAAPVAPKTPAVGSAKTVSKDLKTFGIDPYREPVE